MRARNLKPGFFENEELAECSPFARLLFAGLWCVADRDGRLEDRPKRIKAQVFPYDDVDADALLDELESRRFIVRYEAGGIRYIAVLNFGKHQHPHIKEAPSTIPAPDEHQTSTVQEQKSPGGFPITDSLIPDTPFSDSLIPDSGKTKPPRAHAREEAATAVAVVDTPHAVVSGFLEELGTPEDGVSPAWKSEQRGHAKRLIEQGYGVDKVRRCTRFMLSEKWRDSPFDLGGVWKAIGSWEARGSPETAGALKAQRKTEVTELSPAMQAIVQFRRDHEDDSPRDVLGENGHLSSLPERANGQRPRVVDTAGSLQPGARRGETG